MQNVSLPLQPVPPLPAFSVVATLDAVTYTLRFQWMEADAGWRVSVYDEPGQTLLAGQQRLATDWPLYKTVIKELRRPPGRLFLYDTTGSAGSPTLAGVGDRWLLFYLEASEVG